MARAVVRVDELERGDFPAVCAKTGIPCANPVRGTLKVRDRLRTRRRVSSIVPIARTRTALVRRVVELSWIALAGLVAGVVWAFAGGGGGAAIATGAGLVGYGLLVALGSRLWIGARVSDEPDVVVLTRVHPEFARAVDVSRDATN